MKYLQIVDPNRPKLFGPKKFVLNEKQINAIKSGNLVDALCLAVDLEVYKAFRRPENLALL